MADLRTRLSLDGSDFGKTLEDAGKQVGDFQKKTDDASKSVDGMGKASSRTASELLKQMKTMEGLGRSAGNYRQQLAQMQSQIQDLTINYAAMTEEMKNSEFGQEVAAQIDTLKGKAAELKDAIMDAQSSVKLLASDTANLDAAKMGIETISGAFSLVASSGIFGAESTEKLVKVIARLKAIESATNGVIKIANALNKDSILMMKLKELWHRKNTTAIVKQTAAQQGLNAAMAAAPFMLIVAAIAAVIAIYAKWSNKMREQQALELKGINITEEMREKWKQFGDTIGSSIGKATSEFDKLKDAYTSLDTLQDRQSFLKAYANELENLGLKAKTVNDLEEIFVRSTDKYRRAVQIRAEITALQSLMEEEYAKQFKAAATAAQQHGVQAGKIYTNKAPEWFSMQGLTEGIDYTIISQDIYDGITAELTQSGANKMNAAFGNMIYDAAENGAQKANQAIEAWIESLRSELKPLTLFNADPKDLDEVDNKTKEIKQTVQETQNYWVMPPQFNLTLNKAQTAVNSLQNDLKNLSPDSWEYQLVWNYLILWQGELDRLQKEYDKVTGKVDNTAKKNKEAAKTMHDFYAATNDIIGSFSNVSNGISSIYDTWKNLSEGIKDKDPFESMMYSLDAVLSTLSTIVSIVDTINNLTKLWNTLESVGLAIQEAKNTAKTQEAAIEAGQTATKATNATIDATGAAANVAKSASAIPVVGWVLALGAVAAIIAMIASAGNSLNFANGGIVPGTSFSGDRIQANLNSGEMVLNTQQQRNLFNMLDGRAAGYNSGKVEFVIKGQELKGVLNNYDKKMSRI